MVLSRVLLLRTPFLCTGLEDLTKRIVRTNPRISLVYVRYSLMPSRLAMESIFPMILQGNFVSVGKVIFFSLHSGIHNNISLKSLFCVYLHRMFEYLFAALFPDTLAKICQAGRVAKKFPLEKSLTAKCLKIKILYPLLNHSLIAQVLKLLEYQQANHETHGLCWSARMGVQRGKMLFKAITRDCSTQT